MFGYNVLGFGAGGGAKFIAATGGCVAESGNYKVHTFNSPGTFCVSCIGDDAVVSYIVVAGGGGGSGPQYGGGAGGGGGFRESKAATGCYTASPLDACGGLPISVQGYPITVGAGGAGAGDAIGNKGSNSVFSSITSTGGGYGGRANEPNATVSGGPGGSGGGAGARGTGSNPTMSGGQGNQPPVSPPQGTIGGGYDNVPPIFPTSPGSGGGGGGGGGATQQGGTGGNYPTGRHGGTGATSSITGSPVARSGGGGGGDCTARTPGQASINPSGGAPTNLSLIHI